MSNASSIALDAPRFESAAEFLVAGIAARYSMGGDPGIPQQWQQFAPHIGQVPGQVGMNTYGVMSEFDDGGKYSYLAGVEVQQADHLPAQLQTVRIPARRYAVFTHRGHVTTISTTFGAIYRQWLPQSGFRAADAPSFERYDQRFNPMTGMGEVECWLPLED